MAPRIVILADGTWCGRETNTKTNIYRLARLFELPIDNPNTTKDVILEANPGDALDRQVVARYRHGVGLGGTFLDYLFNGATASDLAAEVIATYKFIVDNHTDAYEIWMFGLSRGAYVVRAVAGLINNYGIINRKKLGLDDAQTEQMCRHAYYLYRSDRATTTPHCAESRAFRLKNSWPLIGDQEEGQPAPRAPVRFMGLFDTVGSLGIPTLTGGLGLNWPEFHDDVVSSVVQDVCHLVSIHDRLWMFQPCLARRKEGREGLHEEWIPGCHYDLGRQKFRFWRSGGGGVVEKLINAVSYLPIIGHGLTIEPNMVLSDFAFFKMLDHIRRHDDDGVLLPDHRMPVPVPHTRKDQGSGDVYANIVSYGLGSLVGPIVTRAFSHLALWNAIFDLRERMIPTADANVYRYRRPDTPLHVPSLDQLADITEGPSRRYPSRTAESWAQWNGQQWP
ncbi:hypothetical protein QBC35DRAFT_510422 [Podospora australis]|uniref:T6SS Phospholipase effector Tle1-like catalytic domain-containing protein n=1 Tax=Podospora australis TaxID=1536484 RepID=A0AAN6WI04_9PEZI|nr:hypothetical protein QBC35DRAFT_510422 [Podospora australis]